MRTYWLSLAAVAVLTSGCDDECKVGLSECVSGSLIRTCVPTDDGEEWLVHQCGQGERCERAAQGGGDAGPDGGPDQSPASGAACVGTCATGDHACVTPALARICINGGVWQLDACDVGETCSSSSGACEVGSGEGTVQRCTPGARACASDRVEKVCDADGTAWVEQMCLANQSCQDDRCQPDPKSSCDDANACLDNKTAVRCLGGDQGFELVECTGDLYCEAGRCRGPVCAIGSLCTAGDQVRECVDGKSYKDSQCGVNETCQQLKDVAKCVPKMCQPGTSACGDPRDSSVDAKKFFTTCAVAAGGSGVPEWVRGECTGNTSCDPALAMTANPCSQECTQGAQRCANDPVTGVNDGYQECGDDGKWGPTKTCNTDSQSEKQCALAPNPNASVLPKAVCADPVCWWAWSNPNTQALGACEGDRIRTCELDGTLSEPMPCPQGVCRTVNSVTTADGRTPATCDTMPQCEEGEELCLDVDGDVTPRYRTCVNGYFSTAIQTCEDDGACYNSRDEAGKRRKVCGAECAPGSGRCNDAGEIERCDADGRWGDGRGCEIGVCRELGSNDASCVLECVPGSRSCTGSEVTAPDGYHRGRDQERVCQDDGTWGDPMACQEGRVCRTTNTGVTLGCVACIGPNAPGGNSESSIDTRCAPDNDSQIQDCGDNDSWLSARACADGKACIEPVAQTCGTCTGAAGGTFPCTDSNLRTEQICAPCAVPLTAGGPTTIPECTQTAIAATADTATMTCSGVTNGGTPGSWAGETDCCSGYQRTALQSFNAGCNTLNYGAPVMWGGFTDCCTNYRMGTTGASFAYCD